MKKRTKTTQYSHEQFSSKSSHNIFNNSTENFDLKKIYSYKVHGKTKCMILPHPVIHEESQIYYSINTEHESFNALIDGCNCLGVGSCQSCLESEAKQVGNIVSYTAMTTLGEPLLHKETQKTQTEKQSCWDVFLGMLCCCMQPNESILIVLGEDQDIEMM